jgi:hypothetical protein
MSNIEPYLSARPLAADDLKAVATAFGLGPRAAVRELTPEEKARQEAKLAPHMRRSR